MTSAFPSMIRERSLASSVSHRSGGPGSVKRISLKLQASPQKTLFPFRPYDKFPIQGRSATLSFPLSSIAKGYSNAVRGWRSLLRRLSPAELIARRPLGFNDTRQPSYDFNTEARDNDRYSPSLMDDAPSEVESGHETSSDAGPTSDESHEGGHEKELPTPLTPFDGEQFHARFYDLAGSFAKTRLEQLCLQNTDEPEESMPIDLPRRGYGCATRKHTVVIDSHALPRLVI
ncbi:hypothetical protein K488DRAFT_69984 [Vararia minispora EC-137]|uniref:Uncharacterized protein n=1 Tax=Vararia minispora EC-137 TaxID=1314806 RepID=A0ACB8QPK1_9AGAM|nr:hypothetical protein K488DRAFT_69984 [Vararia minispora EC-137]